MKIYTRTGDDGETALFGGARVRKHHLRVCAYGAVDEANAAIGMCAVVAPTGIRERLTTVMSDLFDVGAELATPESADDKLTQKLAHRVDAARIHELEVAIDEAERDLPPLTTFVLPTGCEASARLHFARTVLRRAEREVVALQQHEPMRGEVLSYLNRLSDALFVWARLANARAGVLDTPWQKR